jgi:hypothetical protein
MESSTPNGDYPFFRKEFFNGIRHFRTFSRSAKVIFINPSARAPMDDVLHSAVWSPALCLAAAE